MEETIHEADFAGDGFAGNTGGDTVAEALLFHKVDKVIGGFFGEEVEIVQLFEKYREVARGGANVVGVDGGLIDAVNGADSGFDGFEAVAK